MKLKPGSFSTIPNSLYIWEKFSGIVCIYEGKYIIKTGLKHEGEGIGIAKAQ